MEAYADRYACRSGANGNLEGNSRHAIGDQKGATWLGLTTNAQYTAETAVLLHKNLAVRGDCRGRDQDGTRADAESYRARRSAAALPPNTRTVAGGAVGGRHHAVVETEAVLGIR